jgi:4'-phosphopantetheinyl transferase
MDDAIESLPCPDGVLAWKLRLDLSPTEIDVLTSYLDDLERLKASAFGRADLRRRYIARHGLARLVLSRLINRPPRHVQIATTAEGKPFLPGESLHFNLSHTQETAIVAASTLEPIGVDIEAIRPGVATESLMSEHFTERELLLVRAASGSDRPALFTTFWARKEACAKALGTGLSEPLTRFEVSTIEDADQCHPVRCNITGTHFRVFDLPIGSDLRAAIAVKHQEGDEGCGVD